MQGVVFKNVSVTDGNFPKSRICRPDGSHAVKGVTIEDLRILSRKVVSPKEGQFATNQFDEGGEFQVGMRLRHDFLAN
jgi:hypothetical protein